MGLGSSCLEKVVIPYTNSPSTNPDAKLITFSEFCKKLLTNIVRSFATLRMTDVKPAWDADFRARIKFP